MSRPSQQISRFRIKGSALFQLFFLYFTSIGMFYTVGATVGDTLFLSSLSPERVPSVLPWVYVSVGVANVLSALLLDAAQARISRLRVVAGTQLVLAFSVVGFRQLIDLDIGALYLGLVVWIEACALVSITIFFSFAGDYFSAREARRWYGYLAGGMALGTLVSGYLIGVGVGLIGTRNLLYAGAALLLINACLCWVIFRYAVPAPIELEAEESAGERVSMKMIFSRPYVRLVALSIPLALVISVVVDYQMKWVASTKSEQELALFFGVFWERVGIAQLLVQFLVVPPLLRRLGIINCLMVLPVMVGLASSLLLTGSVFNYFGLGLLALSAGANAVRLTLFETLHLPSRELLFLPLPTRIRLRAQPFMDVALAPAGQALGGLLLLLLFSLHVGVEKISLVAAGCSLLLIFVLFKLRPRYSETLAATLRARETEASDLTALAQSPTVDPVLAELLRSPDPNTVRFTLGLIRERPIGDLMPLFEELVRAPDSSVAVEALRRLGSDPSPERLPLIRRARKRDRRQEVREAALLAFCQASGPDKVDEIAALLDSEDSTIKQAAIVGLARYCGDAGQFIARSSLQLYAESPQPAMRRAAARIVGMIGRPGYADMLEELLFDDESEVRLQAAEAAALTADVELISLLLGLMNDAELRSPAMRALGCMPQSGVERFADRIRNDLVSVNERRLLLRTLARIGGPEAVGLLWQQIGRADQKLVLRVEAGRALRSLRISEGLYRLDLRGFKRLQAELQATVQLLNQAREEVGGADDFTARVYRDHAFLNIELMLSLYALKHAPHQIDRTIFNLFADDPTVRSRALELLDVVLPRNLAPGIVSLIQPAIDEPARPGAGLAERTVDRLLRSSSWIRTVTARHLSRAASARGTANPFELSPEERELYGELDVIAFLKSAPLFRDLPADYLSEQTDMAEWLELKKGQKLFQQGDPGDALYVIAEGEMQVIVDGVEVNRLGPGESIGEMALLDDQPRSATVAAGSDARLLLVTAVGFQQLLETEPAVARAIMRTLDQRIRKTQSGRKVSLPPVEPQQRASRESMVSLLNLPNLHQIISKVSFLQQVELFKDLPPGSLTRLATIVQEVSFYRGEELFQQGDVGDCLYLVSQGVIDIIVEGNQVARLGKNACLGEMALIGGLTRSATARVAEDARLLRLWSEDFYQLLATEPEVAMALVRTLATRLRQVSRPA